MASLKQLYKERARLLAQRKKNMEYQKVRREVFDLKHGRKLEAIRSLVGKARGFAKRYQKRQAKPRKRSRRSSGGFDYGGSVFG